MVLSGRLALLLAIKLSRDRVRVATVNKVRTGSKSPPKRTLTGA